MAKKKYYASYLMNGEYGIFESWDVCQDFIRTCPSNAKFRGFATRTEAEDFLSLFGVGARETSRMASPQTADSGDISTVHAYVDGSYNSEAGAWGYGVVMFPADNPAEYIEFSGSGQSDANANVWNVAGEIHGVLKAVEEAVRCKYNQIVVFYDYQGIESWVTGAWRAKIPFTQDYRRKMDGYKQKINISFVKVAAHTGVKYNERADVLAKSAAGIL